MFCGSANEIVQILEDKHFYQLLLLVDHEICNNDIWMLFHWCSISGTSPRTYAQRIAAEEQRRRQEEMNIRRRRRSLRRPLEQETRNVPRKRRLEQHSRARFVKRRRVEQPHVDSGKTSTDKNVGGGEIKVGDNSEMLGGKGPSSDTFHQIDAFQDDSEGEDGISSGPSRAKRKKKVAVIDEEIGTLTCSSHLVLLLALSSWSLLSCFNISTSLLILL